MPSDNQLTLVVMPTYNERENLPVIIPQVLSQAPGIHVLVVDDNSPDGTGTLADEMAAEDERINVLHRPGKLGLGTAYIAGFKWALEHDYELVFEMDSDFSHNPEHIPEFLETARQYDLVLGSRYLKGVTVVNWPMSRLLLSYFANIYARVITEGAGRHRSRRDHLGRVLVPDRDQFQGLAERVQDRRDHDRFYRPHRRKQQDEWADHTRGDLEGVVAAGFEDFSEDLNFTAISNTAHRTPPFEGGTARLDH
jgi:dolichol-phosphate mannosyltransferase